MYVLRLQRLGQTMEEGTIVAWLIEEGAVFNVGDEIYEVATEKASVVVEATRGGRLLRQIAKADDLLPVGGILAVIAENDEQPDSAAIDALLAQSAATIAEDEAQEAPVEPAAEDSAPKSEPAKVAALPAARRLAAELGVALDTLKGTGPEGSITVADVRRASESAASSSADGV
ncbi:MAG TPA: E3 binding domain-containing protein, partial [Rhizomicrobium sp.]|nr:E3 binding domain-containing protein [Rhizomicrobium sp.]